MKKKVSIAAVSLAVAVLASIAPSQASELTYISGPGEQFKGYTLPVLVVQAGTTLTYLNLDPAIHNLQIESCGVPARCPELYGSSSRTWCELGQFSQGNCPLFWSPDRGLAGQTKVYGFEDTPAGTYTFKCIHHPAQRGTLVVV